MKTAILFIIFNRLDTALKVFERIREARPQRLYIAGDGPRIGKPEEALLCDEVRDKILSMIDWPCSVKTRFQDSNLGCALGVSTAISWFFQFEEEGIILEDDCLPVSSFFPFCEELLTSYRHNNLVGVISGNNFQRSHRRSDDCFYFSGMTNIWGWATWRRVWEDYTLNLQSIFTREDVVMSTFKRWRSRSISNFFGRVYDMIAVDNPWTWDYQLTISQIMHNRLQITPHNNLVMNIGFDDRATHTKGNKPHFLPLMHTSDLDFPLQYPSEVSINMNADKFYFRNVALLGWTAIPKRFILRFDRYYQNLISTK